ncbi:MAG: TIGR00730 family Rossman fold protein [Deltaproteobacteria bacterium]|nr:TIGR00730 family Rossman fold protein [Deltaproteobacteria bacterium]
MSADREVKRVCVFCGSRPGTDPAFLDAAAAMGKAIASRGMTLVYGGAKVGLMGAVAAGALGAGGKVVGILPKSLVSKEIAHDGLTELFLTESMHERKERMILLSDAFVSLPGGFGTYDELFEVLTLAQIGLHDKPQGLLNVNGFFEPLVKLLDHTIAASFAAPQHASLYVVDTTPEALLDRIVAWRPPPLGEKWIDRRGNP